MSTVLVVGTGEFQRPLISHSQALGHKVIGMDGNPSSPGAGEVDSFYNIDLKDKEKALEMARVEKVNAVVTAGTDFSTTVSYITENMGLPGIPYKTAYNMSHKYLMRKLIQKAKIPQPSPFYFVSEKKYLESAFKKVGFPLIMKPCMNMGGRGVVVCEGPEVCREHYQNTRSYDPNGEVITERYISDPRAFSVDSIWIDGKMIFISIADRMIVLYEKKYPIELGHIVPSSFDPASIIDTMVRVGKAFDFKTGCIKGDLMMGGQGEILVGEVAARLSGSFNSSHTIPLVHNIHPHEIAVRLALGEPCFLDLSHESEGYAVERTKVGEKKGIVEKVEMGNGVKSLHIMKTHVWKKVGQAISPPTTNMDKVANVVSYSRNSLSEALEVANLAIKGIKVEVR